MRVSYFLIRKPNIKFQNPSMKGSCTKKLDGQTDGWTNEGKIICPINFNRNSGHDQVIYSSLPIYSSSFKAPASIVFLDILLTRETCPNLQRAITYEIFFSIYKKKVNQVIYSSLPINSPNFKSLALTVFEIFC